jgi:hypothetical protein
MKLSHRVLTLSVLIGSIAFLVPKKSEAILPPPSVCAQLIRSCIQGGGVPATCEAEFAHLCSQ